MENYFKCKFKIGPSLFEGMLIGTTTMENTRRFLKTKNRVAL